MSKLISANLLASSRAQVTTLAICIEIRRRDGRTYRLTNHDQDITFEDKVFRHDIPFMSAAFSSGSQFQVNNTEIALFYDEEIFLRSDFTNGLFDHADCTISLVDFEHPEYGDVIMARGWFGPLDLNQHQVVKITVVGLLKILDFEVGRVYQPSCDADLGDKRCMVAIDQSQAYSYTNPYHVGQWVYKYDPDLMSEVELVNGGFEADGARSISQPITGWTRGPGTIFQVAASGAPIGVFDPFAGSYMLMGDENPAGFVPGLENFVYKDVDLTASAGPDAAGINAADIDDGQMSFCVVVALLQALYLLDPPRLMVEVQDADGEVIDVYDTGYLTLDAIDVWREQTLAFPLVAGARGVRIYLYGRVEDGVVSNNAFDHVRAYFWNHLDGSPYDDVVHRLTRIVLNDESAAYFPVNSSWEANGAVANALSPTIAGWITTGSWWRVATSLAGLEEQDGDFMLVGGDDGGVTQQTYTASQTFHLVNDAKLDATQLDFGRIMAKMQLWVGFGDENASAATVYLEFYDASNVLITTRNQMTAQDSPDVTWGQITDDFVIPALTRSIKVVLQAISPVGDGAANIAFDDLRFYFHHTERHKKTDPVLAFGSADTAFDTSVGGYTFDGTLIWKGVASFVQYDEVASVTDNKLFIGTSIVGAEGTYELGVIRWLSGANAGMRNIIRTWNPDTKALKLYFRTPYPIQPGDRFLYIRSCQKRFLEDCQGIFSNQINFRGFPHLPGRLTEES